MDTLSVSSNGTELINRGSNKPVLEKIEALDINILREIFSRPDGDYQKAINTFFDILKNLSVELRPIKQKEIEALCVELAGNDEVNFSLLDALCTSLGSGFVEIPAFVFEATSNKKAQQRLLEIFLCKGFWIPEDLSQNENVVELSKKWQEENKMHEWHQKQINHYHQAKLEKSFKNGLDTYDSEKKILYKFYSTSAKHGSPTISWNMEINDDSENFFVCRHFSALLELIAKESGQSGIKNFFEKMTSRENASQFLKEIGFDNLEKKSKVSQENGAQKIVFSLGKFGELVYFLSRSMAKGEARTFPITAWHSGWGSDLRKRSGHAMTLCLYREKESSNPDFLFVGLHDSNATANMKHTKNCWGNDSIIKGIEFEKLLLEPEWLDYYVGGSSLTVAGIEEPLLSGVVTQFVGSGNDEKIDSIAIALAEGAAVHILELIGQLDLTQINTLTDKQITELKNGLHLAMAWGHAEAIKAYGEMLIGFLNNKKLNAQQVSSLLAAKAWVLSTPGNNGATALYKALKGNHAGAIRAYGEVLVTLFKNGWLTAQDLKELLVAQGLNGVSGFCEALQGNHAAAIKAYGDVLTSLFKVGGLKTEDLKELLSARSNDGTLGFLTLKENCAEAKKAYENLLMNLFKEGRLQLTDFNENGAIFAMLLPHLKWVKAFQPAEKRATN